MSNYYLLMCLLPPMPTVLGEKISLGFGEIAGIIKRNVQPEHIDIVHASLQGIDAFNWEQADQGRNLFLEGGTLSREEISGQINLPPFIKAFREEKERGLNRICLYDRFWELYYNHVLAVAHRYTCRFLIDYVSWEIEMRLALAAMRIKDKSGNFEEHVILKYLRSRDFTNFIAQVKSKKNPLEVERYLDEERLRQTYKFEGISGFSIDALMGYMTRAAIYYRWGKISENIDIDTYLWQGGSK